MILRCLNMAIAFLYFHFENLSFKNFTPQILHSKFSALEEKIFKKCNHGY